MKTHRLAVGPGEEIVVDWYLPEANPPLGAAVFIHGFASDRKGEKALFFAETLTRIGWAFAAVDLRSHGEASGNLETLTISRCVEDISVLMDWMPISMTTPMVLIGSSMGGAVSAWYTVRHPGQVNAVAWIAPSLTFPNSLVSEIPAGQLSAWKDAGQMRYRNEWLDVTLGYDLVTDGQTYDYRELLAAYRLPTLIFHGIQDDAVPWQASVDFVKNCPNKAIDLVVIKQGDHRLTDHKGFLGKALVAWIERVFPG